MVFDVYSWGLLIGSLFGSIGPWLWIGLKLDTQASAWGSSPGFFASRSHLDTIDSNHTVSEAYLGNLEGRQCYVFLLLMCAFAHMLYQISKSPENALLIATSYAFCWLTASLVLAFAWKRIGEPNNVHAGLLANFFIFGGVLGCAFAMFFEIAEQKAFSRVLAETHTHCSMQLFNGEYRPITPFCGTLVALMWILLAGLVEETGKAMWLFWRFRRSDEDVPESCCFKILPSHSSKDIAGGWYKLCETPYHVVLAALASGAGFECVENLKYVFINQNLRVSIQTGSLLVVAMLRCLTSGLHIVWTGLIGVGLAKRLFYPESKRPSLMMTVVPSIVLHGLFDFSLSAMQAANVRGSDHIMSNEAANSIHRLSFGIFLISSIGSCVVLCVLTGCTCRKWGCAPGFWPDNSTWAEAREPFVVLSPPAHQCIERLPDKTYADFKRLAQAGAL